MHRSRKSCLGDSPFGNRKFSSITINYQHLAPSGIFIYFHTHQVHVYEMNLKKSRKATKNLLLLLSDLFCPLPTFSHIQLPSLPISWVYWHQRFTDAILPNLLLFCRSRGCKLGVGGEI